jgi:Tol biopolymer transport system component
MTAPVPRIGRLVSMFVAPLLAVAGCAPDYNPVPIRSEADALNTITQLTAPTGPDGFARAGDVRLSPDMRWAVFRAVPQGAGNTSTEESYGLFMARVRWSTDGGGRHIAGLERPVRITRVGVPCGSACFSPDGFSLAFTAGDAPAAGPTTVPTTRPQAMNLFRADNWEQAVSMTDVARGVDLALYRVTPPGLYVVDCDWSPTGRSIAVAASDGGPVALFALRPDGSRLMRLGPVDARSPAFSPDGHRLAYRTGPAATAQVSVADVVLDVAGDAVGLKDAHRLTHESDVACTGPSWMPDGDHLVYAAVREGRSDLHVMSSADGTRKTRLTLYRGPDVLPAVSPDGLHLLWTTTRGPDASPQLFAADLTLPEGS